jgi:uncharacterized protein involved in outer membrane biogenesis
LRKLLLVLGFLVLGALAAAVAAPWLIDAGQYRDELARRVSAATGREVAIDGPVAFVLLPSPRVRASDVRVVAAEADAPATIDAKHVELELGWASLLGRSLEITHLRVIEPRVVIAAPRSPAVGSVPQLGPIAPVRIERTEIQNGRVVWSDPAAKTPRTIEQLQATILASPLASSIRLAGSAVFSAVPVEFDAVIGEAPPGRPNPVSLTIGVRPGLARATLRGGYDAAAKALRGKLQIEGGDLFAATATVGQLPPLLAGMASQAFSASGDLNWTSAGIAANDLVLQLGDTRATGAINATAGQTLAVDVALAITWLDLDKLSQLERRAATPQRAARPADSAGARVGMGQSPPPSAANPPIDLAVDLGIEAIGLHGGTLRQVRLNAVMSRGDLVINQASALLPGETEFTGFAQVALSADTPRIDGSLSARSDNLRGLLEWFGLDTSGVPAGRLRRFNGQARIEGTPSRIELTGVDVSFDSTKATGAFAIAPGARIGIGADIKVDQINVDAYALAADAAKAAKDKPPLLERFDANLTLAAQTVTWAGEPLTGVSIDALLHAGDVTLRSAAVAEVVGARVEARGRIASVAQRPSAELEIALDAADGSRALRLVDLVPFMPLPLSLRGQLRIESGGGMAFERLELAYGDIRLGGRGRLAGAPRRLAVDLEAGHLAIEALPRLAADSAGALGIDAAIKADTLSWGAYRVAGARVEAHVDAGVPAALDITGALFGGALDLVARAEAADRGKLGGSLTLRDADLADGLAAVLGTRAISGRGDVHAAFSVPTRFGTDFWGGLSGAIELAGRDGAIDGLDLPLMRSMLDPNDPPADIVDLLGAGLHGGATPFTAVDAKARIQQGALAIEMLRVATPAGEVTGNGGADLARGTVDLALTVPVAGERVPPIELRVKGPVDEARIALDFSKLQRYLGRRQVETPRQDGASQ